MRPSALRRAVRFTAGAGAVLAVALPAAAQGSFSWEDDGTLHTGVWRFSQSGGLDGDPYRLFIGGDGGVLGNAGDEWTYTPPGTAYVVSIHGTVVNQVAGSRTRFGVRRANGEWAADALDGGSGWHQSCLIASCATPTAADSPTNDLSFFSGAQAVYRLDLSGAPGYVSQSLEYFGVTVDDPEPPTITAVSSGVGESVGSGLYTATATATDPGLGVKTLELVRDGTVIGSASRDCEPHEVPCSAEWTASITYDAAALPEGTTTLGMRARDVAGHVSELASWPLVVDRTPPAFDSEFTIYAALDEATGKAIVNWAAAGNVSEEDDEDGPGPVAGYKYRYRHPGGTFSGWLDSLGGLERAEIPAAAMDDVYELEIVPVDDAGNEGVAKAVTVSVDRLGDHCDNTANGAPGDCFDDIEPGPDSEEGQPEDDVTLVEPPGARLAYPASRREIQIGGGGWATVRRQNQSFVIGNVHDGWTMDVNIPTPVPALGWLPGHVNGSYDDCGWVKTSHVESSGDPIETECPDTFKPKAYRFASGINCQRAPDTETCNWGARTKLLRNVTDVDFCLNVEPTPVDHIPVRCENKVPDRLTTDRIRTGYTVAWRYVVNGGPGRRGRFVLVSDQLHHIGKTEGQWGFIPRRAFKKNLCSQTSLEKYACGDPIEES
jgi:hypothetical protein